jgi:type II secretory pathway component PulM
MSRVSETTAGRAWVRASRRERAFVAVGAAAIVVAAGWALLGSPLQNERERLARVLREGQATLALAESRASETAALSRQAPGVRTADPKAAATRVLDERGLRSGVTALDVQDGRVRITFAGIPVASLVALVDALGRDERLFVNEMALTARVEPGQVRAELTLARASR